MDDERAVRSLIREILQQAGYSVVDAGSGSEALQVFKEHQSTIRLLVTDVIMPGQSGTELSNEILRMRPELPILFVSGYCEDYRSAMQSFACLPKPFTRTELVNRVHEALNAPDRTSVEQ